MLEYLWSGNQVSLDLIEGLMCLTQDIRSWIKTMLEIDDWNILDPYRLVGKVKHNEFLSSLRLMMILEFVEVMLNESIDTGSSTWLVSKRLRKLWDLLGWRSWDQCVPGYSWLCWPLMLGWVGLSGRFRVLTDAEERWSTSQVGGLDGWGRASGGSWSSI